MNKYLDGFMKTFPYEGLTYDDVTLVTQYADFLPDDTSLETKPHEDESAVHVGGYGHGHRGADGDCDGARGRHWLHPQES